MSTEFKWTDNLVAEFIQARLHIVDSASFDLIEQFKESKQPNPEWEILKVIGLKSNLTADYNPEYHNSENWNIYSVKRLSDGEVFSIGDKVCYIYNYSQYDVIKKIVLGHYQFGDLSSPAPYFSVENMSFACYIDKIIKYKEPILATRDGVDYYEGEKKNIYCVHTKEGHNSVGAWHIDVHPEFYEALRDHYEHFFSTKETAQEWILFNKPLLSLNEIKNIGQTDSENIYFKKLINAAKNNLNK